MPSNDNVVVKIVSDASGVQPGVEQATGSIGSLGPMLAELNASMKALTAQMAEGFAAGAAGARNLAVGMEEAKVASTGLGSSVGAAVMKIHEGAEAVRTFQMRAKAFAEVYVGLFAGEMIAHGIEKVVGATVEWTQANVRLSQSLGISLDRASGLHAALDKLGIGVDTITSASQRLVRQLKIHENAINELGITTRDANGHFRDTLDIMVDVNTHLGELKAGVDRTAAAQKAYGRGTGDLTALIRLTNEQIEEGTRVAHELGLATSVEGVQAMLKYKDASNEAKEVIEALKISLGNALLPVLTDLASWMRSNGPQAVHMFVSAVTFTIDQVKLFILIVKEAIAQLNLWGAEFQAVYETLSTIAHEIMDLWNLMGKVLGEVPDWGKMKSDWESGMAAIDKSATDHVNHIVSEVSGARAALAGIQAQIAGLGTTPGKNQDALGNPFGLGQFTGKAPPIPGMGGDDRLDDLKDPKNAKQKKPKDDLVQQLDQELEAKVTEWDKEQAAQDQAQQYSLQSIADFWAAALERTNLSAKDKYEIQKKYNAAEGAVLKEAEDYKLAEMKREIEADGANYTKKLADLAKYVTEVKRFCGEKTKEAEAAEKEAADAAKKAAEDSKKAWQEYFALVESMQLARIDDEEAKANFEVQMGLRTKSQLLAAERDFENQRYQIKLKGMQQRYQLDQADPTVSKEALQREFNAIEALWRQHENKINQIDRQAALERTAIERQGIQQIGATFGDHISKMITLQESWRQGLIGIYQGLVQVVASVLQQIIEQWIVAHLTKLLLSKQEAASGISSAAAIAGANGVASWALAPWPIDAGAPAFGASMASAAAAFGGIAAVPSGAGGIWDVAGGLTMLHEKEMVLPAWAATPLRSMLTTGDSSGSGAAAHGGGDVHLHSSPTFNGNIASWQDMVTKHERDMMRWLDRKLRNGAFNKGLAKAA